MTDGDIHQRGEKAQRTLQRIQDEQKTSDHNIELISQFRDYLSSQNLPQDRISRYLYTWRELTPHLDFRLDDPDQEDLVSLVGRINQNNIKEKDVAESTKSEYKKAIRKFYTDFIPNYVGSMSKNEAEELVDFFTINTSSSSVDPDRLPLCGDRVGPVQEHVAENASCYRGVMVGMQSDMMELLVEISHAVEDLTPGPGRDHDF
ncbi:MAG: hypothetical protein ABEI86_12135 [Halobacteriaceae archaeon]